MASAKAPRSKAHRYDLVVRGTGQGFAMTLRDRGIALTDDRITWSFEGRTRAAPLDGITDVHLQTGGAWMGEGPAATCRITFDDDDTLIVSDIDENGLKDESQAEPYGAFVRDLHARLAKLGSAARFTAGYRETQYRVIAVCAFLLAAIGIGIPVVALMLRPRIEVLFLLVGGLGLTVPLFTMLRKNSPRGYEPTQIPSELLP